MYIRTCDLRVLSLASANAMAIMDKHGKLRANALPFQFYIYVRVSTVQYDLNIKAIVYIILYGTWLRKFDIARADHRPPRPERTNEIKFLF